LPFKAKIPCLRLTAGKKKEKEEKERKKKKKKGSSIFPVNVGAQQPATNY
jgi:hypothetical protein